MATVAPLTSRGLYWMQLQNVAGDTGADRFPSDGRGGKATSKSGLWRPRPDRLGQMVYRVLGFSVLAAPAASCTIVLKNIAGTTIGESIINASATVGYFAPWPRFFTLPATVFNPVAGLLESPDSGVPLDGGFSVSKDQTDAAINVLFALEIEGP